MSIFTKRSNSVHFSVRTKEAIAGYLFALPSLAGFAMFFMIPFMISFYYCFTEGIGGVRFVGFKNFISLFQSSAFLLASKNTLLFNMISVPLIMIFSFILALLLNSNIKGLAYFRSFFIMPLVIPVASVILVWQVIFNKYGVLNHFISNFGLSPVDWLKSGWSPAVLVLVYIWKNCGYNVVLFITGLNSIPKEYYESARMDGAGGFTCTVKITIPFMFPTGFFVFIMSIINSFKVFREAYLLAGSYPDPRIYLLQHFMNNNFFNLSYQRLTTAAFVMVLAIGFLVFSLFKIESKSGRYIG